jgi:hypothetical protein
MDDIEKCIPISRELFDRIQSLVGGIDVDLDAPLPPEEISEEEYRAALVECESTLILFKQCHNRAKFFLWYEHKFAIQAFRDQLQGVESRVSFGLQTLILLTRYTYPQHHVVLFEA